jgi:hypothetical protein
MRAAVLTSLTVVLVGVYLALAAVLALSPAAIGVGVLTIALVMAATIAAGSRGTVRATAARS